MDIVYTAILIWNLIAFALMGIDKHKALCQKRRISEKMLFTFAFLFAPCGILCGMYYFRHKTHKTSFKLTLLLAFITNAVLFYIIERI